MRFVDTNVLLYRVSQDPREAAKAQIAARLLEAEDLCLSVQVLQEFYVQATRNSRPDRLSHRDALDLITSWGRYPILDITTALMENALATCARWKISYWDAAIIEAARALGCTELLSEDLSAGHDYAGVRVVDPFATPDTRSRRR